MELLERLKEVCDQVQAAGCTTDGQIMGWLSEKGITDIGIVNAVLTELKRRTQIGGCEEHIFLNTHIAGMAGKRDPYIQVLGRRGQGPIFAATDRKAAAVCLNGSGHEVATTYLLAEDCKVPVRGMLSIDRIAGNKLVSSKAKVVGERKEHSGFPCLTRVLPNLLDMSKVLAVSVNAETLLKLAKAINRTDIDPVVTLLINTEDPSLPIAVTADYGCGAIAPCEGNGNAQSYMYARDEYVNAAAANGIH